MKAVTKDYLREIKNTKSRFMSILVLVALAVSFLSGLRSAAPDMKLTGSNYAKSLRLADIQFLSTLGMTDEDVDEILKRPEIAEAEGVYVIDAFVNSKTADSIAKMYSLTEKNISNVILREGRMPEKDNECVVEELALENLGIKLGDTLYVDTADIKGALKHESFTVVGTVRSPIYFSFERGTATIGTGSVGMYMYMLKDAFAIDYYTAVFAIAEGTEDMQAFSEEYDNYIDGLVDSLRDFAVERAEKRYQGIIEDADIQIGDAEKQLEDARKQLADAEKELANARKQLDDGWDQYFDGVKEIEENEQKLIDGKLKLADGKKQYEDGLKQYQDGLKLYNDNVKLIEDSEKQLADAKKQLDDGERQYQSGLAQYQAGVSEYNSGASQIASAKAQLKAQESQLEQAISGIQTMIDAGMPASLLSVYAGNQKAFEHSDFANQMDYASFAQAYDVYVNQDSYRAQIADGYAQIADAERQLSAASGSIASGEYELSQARKQLDDGWKEYNEGLAQYEDGKKQLEDGKKELDDAKKQLEISKKQIADAEKEITDGEKQLADGKVQIADAKIELENGEKQYKEGYSTFLSEKKKADKLINEGQEEIDDAKSSISKLENCDWYIFDRSYNPGYDGLRDDADRMANLAKVFPLIFFLVAALVCLTNMTRMVEEQRIQIGGMKALGYPRLVIAAKYVGYGFIPSIIGSIIGLAVGFTLFPMLIFTAYQIMYQMPNIELHWYSEIAILCLVASVACTTLSSLWASLSTLRESPASLMRPKTPTAGKRVFLEYITPLWNRLKFIHKVTARNLFRYQKRFWMTVIGIAGCTALIITGVGIRSSIINTLEVQFEDIYHYDVQVALSPGTSEESRRKFEDYLQNNENIVSITAAQMSTCTARSDDGNEDAYLFVIDKEEIKNSIDLEDYKTREPLTLSDDGVFIDQKLSELINVKVGDEFLIDADEKTVVKISGIVNHYAGHFCYATPEYYEKTFGEVYEPNGYLMKLSNTDIEFCNAMFEEFLKFDGVISTSRMMDVEDTYLDSMKKIDFVVFLIIICSGALALIVLYNLSDINISERRRELATIKVLGFYDNEVSAYVYRENIFLTLFGILLGLVFGRILHAWLIVSVEIDLMMFIRDTDPIAYVWAVILTTIFSVIANYVAHLKMKKIDMVESLKSAE